ncbi:PKD domain-containing protein [Taibaiella lutea]|uniref:PKD domain-containing protein n=1 Tax=Taibaiella lutea TaxID=2608001 RepID=A0A5M6CJN1_9BACT|nr:PKD domain-containing protein [Taibaiella lutea]KAA5533319.1 PKD domain-containing protein [Taibaiella lutea]
MKAKKIYTSILQILLISCLTFLLPGKAFSQCQTIMAHVTSTAPAADPVDSVIKICKGDGVTFNGNATFSTGGTGATYSWHFNDGVILNGLSVSRAFPNEGVYVVDFVVTDNQGCVNKNCDSRRIIHVSTTPHFNLTTFPDTVCINKLSYIHGVVTPVEGVYNCAPPIADTTYLPDGSGVSYTTSITVSCFTPCDTVRTAADVESICIDMEHSYIGDLDAKIICPNGQQNNLFHTNGAPGAASQYLGVPVDFGPANGPEDNQYCSGSNYCFRMDATWGPFISMLSNTTPVSCTSTFGNTTTGSSMIAGNYQPEQSYNSLIGCPLNGNWTIQITDHLGSDNGHIFSWGIEFNQSLGSYSFLPTYPVTHWAANADIVATSNGGSDITIKPTTPGIHCYTYQVMDAFNCSYDTTICLYVIDPGNPGKDSSANLCLDQETVNAFDYLAGNPTPGGTWTGTGVTPNGDFNPAAVGVGYYPLEYKLTKWQCDTTAIVTFHVVNSVNIDFSYDLGLGCVVDTVHFNNLSDTGKYWWTFGDGTFPADTTMNPTHIYQDQNFYTVKLIVKNELGCIDSALKVIDITHPINAAFTQSADTICLGEGAPVVFTDASTGAITDWNWNFGEGTPSTAQNPSYIFTQAGNHTIRLIVSDAIPCYDTAYKQVQVDAVPYFSISQDKHMICAGDALNFESDYYAATIRNIAWNFGDGTQWNQLGATTHRYENSGIYWITADADFGACGISHDTDSVIVTALPLVNLGPDSVLCLDGTALTVADLNNASDPGMQWQWSTGATTPSIQIVHPGIYSLTATKNDCATTETIEVNKDCYTDIPNVFTPNGDGVNDYFYPKQLLSKGVVGFSMTIFNRWGQKVFESTTANGRGWDGNFNNKMQPVGVYIYQMSVIMKNGRSEEYTGNVTLMR